MTCEDGTLTEADITRLNTNVLAISDWAEGGPTDTTIMANGRVVPAPMKVITDAKLFKPPIAWPSSTLITDANQSYDYLNVVYAPQPGLLPFTSGASFTPSNWYVLQGITNADTTIKDIYYVNNDPTITDHGATSGPNYDKGNFRKIVDTIGGSTEALIIMPPGVYNFTTAMSTSSNVNIYPTRGAVTKPASAITVTYARMDASPYQVFDISLGGTVALGSKITTFYPEWWDDDAGVAGQDSQVALAACIIACGANRTIILGSAKTYQHSGTLNLLDGQTWWCYGAQLKSDAGMSLALTNMWIEFLTGVRIFGLSIDGNRSARSGTNSGAAIVYGSSDDCILRDITIIDPNNDGIAIGPSGTGAADRSFRAMFTNIQIHRGYRNCMSVTGAVDSFFMNIICNDAAGTAPGAGIDVESQAGFPLTKNENLQFTNIITNGNTQFGFGVLTSNDVNIRVSNIQTNNNGTFGLFSGTPSTLSSGVTGTGNGTSLYDIYGLDLIDIIGDKRYIQTVSGTSGATDTYGVTLTDGTLSVAITTKYASSKVRVEYRATSRAQNSGGGAVNGTMFVQRVGSPDTTVAATSNRATYGGVTTMDRYIEHYVSFEIVVAAVGTTLTFKNAGQRVTGTSFSSEAHEMHITEIAV